MVVQSHTGTLPGPSGLETVSTCPGKMASGPPACGQCRRLEQASVESDSAGSKKAGQASETFSLRKPHEFRTDVPE